MSAPHPERAAPALRVRHRGLFRSGTRRRCLPHQFGGRARRFHRLGFDVIGQAFDAAGSLDLGLLCLGNRLLLRSISL